MKELLNYTPINLLDNKWFTQYWHHVEGLLIFGVIHCSPYIVKIQNTKSYYRYLHLWKNENYYPFIFYYKVIILIRENRIEGEKHGLWNQEWYRPESILGHYLITWCHKRFCHLSNGDKIVPTSNIKEVIICEKHLEHCLAHVKYSIHVSCCTFTFCLEWEMT